MKPNFTTMTKGHNKGKNGLEQSDSRTDNSSKQNHHLKQSKQKDSPNQGRSKDPDPSQGSKKGGNNV